jgi:hypothetical protein
VGSNSVCKRWGLENAIDGAMRRYAHLASDHLAAYAGKVEFTNGTNTGSYALGRISSDDPLDEVCVDSSDWAYGHRA